MHKIWELSNKCNTEKSVHLWTKLLQTLFSRKMPLSTNRVPARKYLVLGVNHRYNYFVLFLIIRTKDDVESFFLFASEEDGEQNQETMQLS